MYLTEKAGSLPSPVNGGSLDDELNLRNVLGVLPRGLYLGSVRHCYSTVKFCKFKIVDKFTESSDTAIK